jgi:hypothetical protein
MSWRQQAIQIDDAGSPSPDGTHPDPVEVDLAFDVDGRVLNGGADVGIRPVEFRSRWLCRQFGRR